jgi:hypothetical protein
MSKGNLVSRLEVLEASAPEVRPVMVWRDAQKGETTEQAIAKRYPEGVPAGAPVYILEWEMAK